MIISSWLLPQCWASNVKLQFVLCHKVLSNDAMKPSKLKRHLHGNHLEHKEKDLSFFKRKEMSLKRQKLDADTYFFHHSVADVEASFELAFRLLSKKISCYQ